MCFRIQIFDEWGMKASAARPTALVLTPLMLLALVGCANSDRHSHNHQAANQPVASARGDSAATVKQKRAQPAGSDEYVFGEALDEDSVPRYHEPVSHYTIEQIRAELESMYEEDRTLVEAAYDGTLNSEVAETIQAIDKAHADRLKEIVDHIGWPTRDLVGLKATQAAYMVIQHAGHDTEFQNECLSMMVDLVEQGELPASYLALLTDRIRVFSGQYQVFGTQMTMARNEMGVMAPKPTVQIEDPENLNDRRALMGMAPHEQFVEAIKVAYEASQIDTNEAYASVPPTMD